MKFLMLLRKELRESLPWIILAAIALVAIGGISVRHDIRSGWSAGSYSNISPGGPVNPHRFDRWSPLRMSGPTLFVISIALGLVLGVQHFWMPHFTRTWPFQLHRSVGKMSILGAKLVAAAIGFIVPLGGVWLALYWYVCRSNAFGVPVPARVLIDGLIMIALGLVVYLAAALASLSRAKWYTTKAFGLAFAAFVLYRAIQCGLLWACVIIVVGIMILLSQVVDTFLKREY